MVILFQWNWIGYKILKKDKRGGEGGVNDDWSYFGLMTIQSGKEWFLGGNRFNKCRKIQIRIKLHKGFGTPFRPLFCLK